MTGDDILQSAAQVFRQKGFYGASMADIAEAVRPQKPGLCPVGVTGVITNCLVNVAEITSHKRQVT